MNGRHLHRREVVAVLAGGALPWPLTVHAQQPRRLPVIGFASGGDARIAAFVQRLRELGWIDGRTVSIEFRDNEGRSERFPEIAADFVRRKVDVIVVSTSGPVLEAAKLTSTIPIVFPIAADPLNAGLVASLARPGRNITGLSLQTTDLIGKRLEILREVVSGLVRLAVLANHQSASAVIEMREVTRLAEQLGLETVPIEIRSADDIAPALGALRGRADALYVCGDPLIATNHRRINDLARDAKLRRARIRRR